MSLNTAELRAAAIGFGLVTLTLVLPGAGITTLDRAIVTSTLVDSGIITAPIPLENVTVTSLTPKTQISSNTLKAIVASKTPMTVAVSFTADVSVQSNTAKVTVKSVIEE